LITFAGRCLFIWGKEYPAHLLKQFYLRMSRKKFRGSVSYNRAIGRRALTNRALNFSAALQFDRGHIQRAQMIGLPIANEPWLLRERLPEKYPLAKLCRCQSANVRGSNANVGETAPYQRSRRIRLCSSGAGTRVLWRTT
jgi:hypothetical protein